MDREPFPLAPCLLSIVTTSTGLAVAALGIAWGVAPVPGEALPLAWLYVHLMLAITWLILWPALALRPGGTARRRAPRDTLWQMLAMVLGALPAVLVAGFVTGASPNATFLMLALQSGMALLMGGILACHQRFPGPAGLGAGLVAALTLIGPIAAFLTAQFFPSPSMDRGWSTVFPLLAVGRAAAHIASWREAREIWALAAGMGLSGLPLLALARTQEKAPATPVTRA